MMLSYIRRKLLQVQLKKTLRYTTLEISRHLEMHVKLNKIIYLLSNDKTIFHYIRLATVRQVKQYQ